MKKVLSVVLVFVSVWAIAQEPLDGAYVKTVSAEKKEIPYDFVREADVFWQKRIWRMIDVNLKMNLPFKYEQEPLVKIIHDLATVGELTVYDPGVIDADQFKAVLSVEAVKAIGAKEDSSLQINPETFEEEWVKVKEEFDPLKITKFRIKEDWIFNENTSTLICRIIGIAPVMPSTDESGVSIGDKTLYWVYYPDLRPVLARKEVYNPKNDAVRLSWEDLFEARMFESVIYKESNVFHRNIADYAQGVDGVLEADRIKQTMFEWEHDLWSY